MVPLSVRSCYSLMWGTRPPEDLCRAARELGFRRLALADTDNLYGLWPFLKACRREGVEPLVGAEVTDPTTGVRATCLVRNAEGYRNLCRLLTARHAAAPDQQPFILEEGVRRYGAGLIILSADPTMLESWHGAGLNVAASVPRRAAGVYFRAQSAAKRLGIPFVATPGSFFLRREEHEVHCVLRAIALNTSLSRLPSREVAPADAWLAPAAEYERRFAVCPEALAATEDLAAQCTFTGPDTTTVFPPWHGPRDVPAGAGSAIGEAAAAALLRASAFEGARRRYGDDLPENVVERLEYELGVITGKGFASYFLVVQDIVLRAPRICGRGSGAASLVAYCLGITNICPIKHNLYFERFLNPGRTDPPDIDVDFAWDERDAVLKAVLEQYRGHAAMVCNHIPFQPRMAFREVAKVFGLPDGEIKRVLDFVPQDAAFHEENPDEPEAARGGEWSPAAAALPKLGPPWADVLRLAQLIRGLPRYLSVHAGGVVITPRPISEYVPVQPAVKGVPIIQWEKDGTEEGGLVKIDLLGNRSLGVVRDAVAALHANGVPFDESRWEPEDDPATQAAIARGETMGCFYIESPAMRLLQKKTGKGDFEHLVIHSSIIRPAANEYIQEYIRRLHGAKWEPFHPLLAEVLAETYGLMVYQEDVSKSAMALAGFTHAEADRLRKIIAKKDRELHLPDFRARFAAGARAKGVPDETSAKVWDMMMSFAGYSFCKPHSASYARVSFQAAYLKVHHPAEFMAAVLGNEGGFYSTFAYASEARRLGLAILPPEVNRAALRWTGQDRAVRVGLQCVADLAEETRKRIVELRAARPFTDLEDFLRRARPGEAEARALIQCGACDGLPPGPDRTALLWGLARWVRRRTHAGGSPTLFEPPPSEAAGPDALPDLPPASELARLRDEFRVLGLLCECHPMTLFADVLARHRLVKAADLSRHTGKHVRLAGFLITGKLISTRQQQAMQFTTFEDETGLVETVFFPRAYARFAHLLNSFGPFLIAGKVEEEFGAQTLTVERLERLAMGGSRSGR